MRTAPTGRLHHKEAAMKVITLINQLWCAATQASAHRPEPILLVARVQNGTIVRYDRSR
jgi:hypothetical protein